LGAKVGTSCGAAAHALGIGAMSVAMEKQPRREFASADSSAGAQDATFKSAGSARKFVSSHVAVRNTFNVQHQRIALR